MWRLGGLTANPVLLRLCDSKQNLARSFNVLIFETIWDVNEVQSEPITNLSGVVVEDDKLWMSAECHEVVFDLNVPKFPRQSHGAVREVVSEAFHLEAGLCSFQSEQFAPTRRQYHLRIRRVEEVIEPRDTLRVDVCRRIEGTVHNDDTFAVRVVSTELGRVENAVDVEEDETFHDSLVEFALMLPGS